MIVDFRVRLPLERWPQQIRDGYSEHYERYDDILGVATTVQRTAQDLDAELAESGIDHAVVHAEYEFADPADELNEAVAEFVAENPLRRSGFGTVSLGQPSASRMVAQVRRCAALGMRGINVQPTFFGMRIYARELFAVYGACDELGLVVAVHTGVNYDRSSPIENEHPILLDSVAIAFPELRLVACHAAWPWTAELAAVARRHPTVHFDFGGMAPSYLGRPGGGWSPLMSLVDNLLADQALFATDWPVFDHHRAVSEWATIDLKPRTRAKLMGENAANLLGLSPEKSA